MKDKRTLIVIPYLNSEAQGSELALAVEGWRQHFREPYRIVVVGDWHYVCDTGRDIDYIDCPRLSPVAGQYLPHLDHVHKFRRVREEYPKDKGFIYACDDMYAVRDFTLKDVQALKLPVRHDVPPMDLAKETGWWRDLGRTWELNRREGTPTNWNWVCHLPIYYGWYRLLEIYARFDCDHMSYVVENIYFNQKRYPRPQIHTELEYVHQVRTSSPSFYRPEDMGVTWITNARCGWSAELEARLRAHYGV